MMGILIARILGAATVLLPIAALIFIIVKLAESSLEFKAEAIERGYALYCPDTGDFAWKGECGAP